MPTYSTHLLLNNLQQETESHLHLAISEWQMISHLQFAKKPAPESWSANECIQHLNSYGNYYLPAIEKAIRDAEKGDKPSSLFRTGWLGHYFTKLMTPERDGKPAKKMKAPKDHTPTAIINSHEVISTFIEQQEILLQLLEAANKVNLETVRIPISISQFIRLKLGDTFNFLCMHNTRHIMQAQRALGKTGPTNNAKSMLTKALITN